MARLSLRRMLFAAAAGFQIEPLIHEAEDGTPYLSIDTGVWASVMVTPEPNSPGLFGVVITGDLGDHRVHPRQTEGQAIAIILSNL